MRTVGWALLLLGLSTSSFAASTYREVWYPPEAGGVPLHRTTAHKSATNKNSMPRILKPRIHRASRSAPTSTLAMKRKPAPTGFTAKPPEPDLSDIPRQITPEGNILRVDSRNAAARVTR
ncbi:hypothetical protein PQR33_13370 [Paraburkholderia sediminicola]|uniref:hypothetical protein n=1 Tax=Paraburkholderia sediminicola TaxID=458836 RepID=UPI0038BBCF90